MEACDAAGSPSKARAAPAMPPAATGRQAATQPPAREANRPAHPVGPAPALLRSHSQLGPAGRCPRRRTTPKEETSMRTVITTVLALIGGFFVGIVLSEIIGIVGFLLFDSLVGVRFLPVVSAVAVAGPAIAVNLRARRRSASPAPIEGSATDHQAARPDPRS